MTKKYCFNCGMSRASILCGVYVCGRCKRGMEDVAKELKKERKVLREKLIE